MKILSDKIIKTSIMSLMGMTFLFVMPLYSAVSETGISSSTVKFMEFEKTLLSSYETQISSGNPAIAKAFLDNDSFKEKYLKIDKKKASLLIAKSQAVVDLNKIFDFVWNEDNFNNLSDALGERINDKDNILCSMGFGSEPEKLLPWVEKYRVDYKEENILIVKKAIREWDIVFSTSIDKINVDWAQAQGSNQKVVTKEEWLKWNIRQRNAAMNKLLPTEGWKNYADLIDYSEGTDGMIKEYRAKDAVVKDVQVFLSTGQQSQLDTLVNHGGSLDDQMFFLGQLFNGNSITGSPADSGKIEILKAKVNSMRDSFAPEDISPEQNDLLNDMVKTSVMTNMKDTTVGARISSFYATNKLDMEITAIDNNGSYDPKTGKISIDSGLVREFMRVKGYTTESVMANKDQLDEVAKFISPAFVHQVGLQMQDAWAKENGIYKPLTQEDEISASSMEAIYTLEKIKKDEGFRGIFQDFSKISDDSYAAQSIQLANTYNTERGTKFESNLRNTQYDGMPSIGAASSKIIYAINTEIERRAGLSTEKKAEVEMMAYIGKGEAYNMDSAELLSSLEFISAGTLTKINDSLLATDYEQHYQSVTAGNNLTFTISKVLVKVNAFLSGSTVPPLIGVN
jgi:hypothetical protein